MEIITISHKRYTCGFGKPEQLQHDGVRFPNGKIAYLDEDDNIRACENEKELQKALVDAKIEVKSESEKPCSGLIIPIEHLGEHLGYCCTECDAECESGEEFIHNKKKAD